MRKRSKPGGLLVWALILGGFYYMLRPRPALVAPAPPVDTAQVPPQRYAVPPS